MRRIAFARPSIASTALIAASIGACSVSASSPFTGGDGGSQGSTGPGQNDAGGTIGTGSDGSPGASDDSGGNTTEDSGNTSEDSSTLPPFDGGPVSTVYPAPHPAWPTEVFFGGSLLTTPDILTVTFNSDSLATSLAAFGAQATVSTNTYWQTVRAGFCEPGTTTCIGNGAAGTHKAVTTTVAASYTDSSQGGASTLQTFIQSLISGSKITIGANTLPVFYFPQTVSISLDGAPSCAAGGFGGYHNQMTTTAGGGTTFAYAVVMECTSTTPTTLQETTIAASHEIIEASSDPFQTQTASGETLGFYLNENDITFLPWANIGFGEVGDNCVDFFGLGQDEATEGAYTVQRIWNNAAAAAGGDPCVPAQGATKPYFNVAVEQWLVTEGVGATTVFDGDAFSDMAVPGGWNVMGYDLNATGSSGAALSPYLGISVNGVPEASGFVTANNGQKVQVAVTLNQEPGDLVASAGGAVGLLLSFNGTSLATATAGTVWPFLVQSPSDAVDSGLEGYDASEDMPRRPHAKRIRVSQEQLERVWKNLRAIGAK